MAFKIEKALTTLFAAYRLQSQGNLPSVMSEVVTPTIDLNTHALAAAGCESIAVAGSGNPFVLGVIGTTIIAEDWYVVGASCGFVASAAGQSGNVDLDFISPGSPSNHCLCAVNWLGIATTTAAGETTFQNSNANFYPFWARKGSTFSGVVNARAGAAGGTCIFTVAAYRLRTP